MIFTFQITSVGAIFNGPDEYVAVGLEKLRPLSKAQMDLSSKRHRPPERPCVHHGPRALRHHSSRPSGPLRASHDPENDQESPSKRPPRKRNPSTPGLSVEKGTGGEKLRASRSMGQLVENQARSKRRVPGSVKFC